MITWGVDGALIMIWSEEDGAVVSVSGLLDVLVTCRVYLRDESPLTVSHAGTL